jgi:lantibiotic modifying enzyme
VHLLPLVRNKIAHDASLDITSGAAGAILCLLALDKAAPQSDAITLACVSGNKISASLDLAGEGMSSRAKLRYQRGASHGISGIAFALFRLAGRLRMPRTPELRALAELDSNLTNYGVWTDPLDNHHVNQATWCHGASGIALSRLASIQAVPNCYDISAVNSALTATLSTSRHLLPENGLCHGNLGIAEVFYLAERLALDVPGLSPVASKDAVRKTHQSILQNVWPGQGKYSENPGLMTGLAGVGLGLLRYLRPAITPNVLLLDPPGEQY